MNESLYVRDAFGLYQPAEAQQVIDRAKRILAQQFDRGVSMTSPKQAGEAMQLQLGQCEQEIFVGLALDNQHRVLEYAELFRGSHNAAQVYPREVVKWGLRLNASAILIGHNHPSGVAKPSEADRALTARLKEALALVEIRVLDHLVVAADGVYSFAEYGLI